jgi:hypothetical protein
MLKIPLAILSVVGLIIIIAVVTSIILYPLSYNSAPNISALIVTAIGGTLAIFAGFKSALELGTTLLASKIQQITRQVELDSKLFLEIRAILPSNGSIKFMRFHDYAGSFERARHNDLDEFLDRCNQPEFEFFDKDLERMRLLLAETIKEFCQVLGRETFPLDTDIYWNRIPRDPHDDRDALAAFTHMAKDENHFQELIMAQQERVQKARKDLNEFATQIVETYDEFIRLGRKKLGV